MILGELAVRQCDSIRQAYLFHLIKGAIISNMTFHTDFKHIKNEIQK